MHHALRRRILGVCALLAGAALVPASSWGAPGDLAAPAVAVESPQSAGVVQEGPVYDSSREETLTGTVSAVEPGNHGTLGLLMRAHTLGLAHKGRPETLLRIDTSRGNVEVHLGPTDFVNARGMSIREGDGVEVIGSPATREQGSIVLARQIRKGEQVWMVRDPAGQPLWTVAQERSRFWTRNKILVFSIVAAKIVALATVLRH